MAGEFDGFVDPPVLQYQAHAYTFTERNESFNLVGTNFVIESTYRLKPLLIGTYVIGPASIQSGNKKLLSNQVKITILPAKSERKQEKAFLQCEVPDKEFVPGEQIPLTIRLYYRAGTSITIGGERPAAQYVSDFLYLPGPYPVDRKSRDTIVVISGYRYIGKVISREFVFPSRTGWLQIPAYDYACYIRQPVFSTGNPELDNAIGIDVPVVLESNPVPITVASLPEENRPQDFAGDVGSFSLSASLDKTSVKAGEPVKLVIRISGKGNISFLQIRNTSYPPGLQAFSPFTSDSINQSSSGISGQKTFNITLIPQQAGEFTIPGSSFSYFDPAKREYVTLHTPDFVLKVAPGPDEKTNAESNLPEGFLNEKNPLAVIGKIMLIILPVLLFIAGLFYWKKRKRNVVKNPVPPKPVSETPSDPRSKVIFLANNAEQLLGQQNIRSALYIAYESLITASSLACELSREEASPSQIRYRLATKNFPAKFINNIIPFIEELSTLRYASENVSPERATEIIRKNRGFIADLGF